MRLYEFVGMKEDVGGVSTSSGDIAPVVTALGAVQRRNGQSMFTGKYTTDLTPNTPAEYKTYKRKK